MRPRVNVLAVIVAALALSAGGRIAPAGVISDPTGTDAVGPGRSLWTSPQVVWNQPNPDPVVLSNNATPRERTFAEVPGFDRETGLWASIELTENAEATVGPSEPARWSALTPPAGLPGTAAPTVRSAASRRETRWSDPVGVLFAEESIRANSGLARFIPAPATGSMLLLTPMLTAKRRRAAATSSR